MDRTAENWAAALAAMRERSSAAEIIALRQGGAITHLETFGGAWEQCYDKPALRDELIRQFRACSDEDVAAIGDELEKLAAQRESRVR
jgi:hypothetical protein